MDLSESTDPAIFKNEYEKNLYKKIHELRKYFTSINKDEDYQVTLGNLADAKLTINECEELIKNLSNCKEIHDPHGRPVIMRLPINTIKNQFHRS